MILVLHLRNKLLELETIRLKSKGKPFLLAMNATDVGGEATPLKIVPRTGTQLSTFPGDKRGKGQLSERWGGDCVS